jgi:C4-dicarboxylate transporter DctQ subunit
MARINAVVDAVLFYLLAVTLAAVVGICFLQVVARYIFNASFTWAEEVSIILLLWATWGAACYAVKQGAHLRVRILDERINERAGLILRLTLECLAVPFLVVIALTGRLVIDAMTNMTLMSLPSIPRNIMYVSVPSGCVLMIYYILRSVFSGWKSLRVLIQENK